MVAILGMFIISSALELSSVETSSKLDYFNRFLYHYISFHRERGERFGSMTRQQPATCKVLKPKMMIKISSKYSMKVRNNPFFIFNLHSYGKTTKDSREVRQTSAG
jgi:hypothetical protein